LLEVCTEVDNCLAGWWVQSIKAVSIGYHGRQELPTLPLRRGHRRHAACSNLTQFLRRVVRRRKDHLRTRSSPRSTVVVWSPTLPCQYRLLKVDRRMLSQV
jgi:hypothetical protein